jgi:hypothetical protein
MTTIDVSEMDMDEIIETRATALIDDISDALEAEGLSRPNRIVYLVPGTAVVWDSCCEGGQLSARLANLTPHISTAHNAAHSLACSIDYWTATIEITLLRCAQTVKNTGAAPSAAKLTIDGAKGTTDMRILLEQITLQDYVQAVGPWLPLGPQGGCFGNSWNFTMILDATPCGPDPDPGN